MIDAHGKNWKAILKPGKYHADNKDEAQVIGFLSEDGQRSTTFAIRLASGEIIDLDAEDIALKFAAPEGWVGAVWIKPDKPKSG